MKYLRKLLKNPLFPILLGLLFFLPAFVIDHVSNTPTGDTVSLVFYLIALLISGGEVFVDAVRGIFHRKFLDEKFLMSVASIGAVCIGAYAEGVAVMIFARQKILPPRVSSISSRMQATASRRKRILLRNLQSTTHRLSLPVRFCSRLSLRFSVGCRFSFRCTVHFCSLSSPVRAHSSFRFRWHSSAGSAVPPRRESYIRVATPSHRLPVRRSSLWIRRGR